MNITLGLSKKRWLEIKIVVAIIGILLMIIVPSYCGYYTARAQVTAGIIMAEQIKADVEDFWKNNHRLPSESESREIINKGSYADAYVSKIALNDGVITITYGNKAEDDISGRTLGIVPVADDSDNLSWVCGFASNPIGTHAITMIPGGTTINKRQLPLVCRER